MDTESTTTTPWTKAMNSDQMKSRKIQSPSSTNENSNKTTSPSSITVNQNNNVVALLNQIGGSKSVLINTNNNNISKLNDNNDHLATTVIPVTSIEPHHAIITNANGIDFYSLQNNSMFYKIQENVRKTEILSSF